jgi:uncharacterized protein with FMN-binding domain
MNRVKFFPVIFLLITRVSLAQFTPGTYSGFSDSRDFNELRGTVNLKVYLSAARIDSIEVTGFDHDIYHKIYGPLALKAKNSLPKEVLDRQSISVDGISGATISSNSILLAIARALEKGRSAVLKDGLYTGSSRGRKDDAHSGIINLKLAVSDSKISSITFDSIDQVTDHKRWGYYVKKAIKDIPDAVLSRQSLEVDAVSQATNTSHAILLAVARALEKAQK